MDPFGGCVTCHPFFMLLCFPSQQEGGNQRRSLFTCSCLLLVHEENFKSLAVVTDIHTCLHAPGILIPLPVVITTLAAENQGYTFNSFPPFFCTPTNGDMIFYSQAFLDNVTFIIGIPMLIIVAWTLHKVWYSCRNGS